MVLVTSGMTHRNTDNSFSFINLDKAAGKLYYSASSFVHLFPYSALHYHTADAIDITLKMKLLNDLIYVLKHGNSALVILFFFLLWRWFRM